MGSVCSRAHHWVARPVLLSTARGLILFICRSSGLICLIGAYRVKTLLFPHIFHVLLAFGNFLLGSDLFDLGPGRHLGYVAYSRSNRLSAVGGGTPHGGHYLQTTAWVGHLGLHNALGRSGDQPVRIQYQILRLLLNVEVSLRVARLYIWQKSVDAHLLLQAWLRTLLIYFRWCLLGSFYLNFRFWRLFKRCWFWIQKLFLWHLLVVVQVVIRVVLGLRLQFVSLLHQAVRLVQGTLGVSRFISSQLLVLIWILRCDQTTINILFQMLCILQICHVSILELSFGNLRRIGSHLYLALRVIDGRLDTGLLLIFERSSSGKGLILNNVICSRRNPLIVLVKAFFSLNHAVAFVKIEIVCIILHILVLLHIGECTARPFVCIWV